MMRTGEEHVAVVGAEDDLVAIVGQGEGGQDLGQGEWFEFYFYPGLYVSERTFTRMKIIYFYALTLRWGQGHLDLPLSVHPSICLKNYIFLQRWKSGVIYEHF